MKFFNLSTNILKMVPEKKKFEKKEFDLTKEGKDFPIEEAFEYLKMFNPETPDEQESYMNIFYKVQSMFSNMFYKDFEKYQKLGWNEDLENKLHQKFYKVEMEKAS